MRANFFFLEFWTTITHSETQRLNGQRIHEPVKKHGPSCWFGQSNSRCMCVVQLGSATFVHGNEIIPKSELWKDTSSQSGQSQAPFNRGDMKSNQTVECRNETQFLTHLHSVAFEDNKFYKGEMQPRSNTIKFPPRPDGVAAKTHADQLRLVITVLTHCQLGFVMTSALDFQADTTHSPGAAQKSFTAMRTATIRFLLWAFSAQRHAICLHWAESGSCFACILTMIVYRLCLHDYDRISFWSWKKPLNFFFFFHSTWHIDNQQEHTENLDSFLPVCRHQIENTRLDAFSDKMEISENCPEIVDGQSLSTTKYPRQHKTKGTEPC